MTSPALVGRSETVHEEETHCDLNQVVSSAERSILQIAGGQVAVQMALSPSTLSVALNEVELTQIVRCLAGEARRLLGSGGRMVVETRGLNDGHVAPLQLSETAAKARARVIVRAELLGSAPPATQTEGPASGELGVSAVEALLERLGGRLEFVPLSENDLAYVAHLPYAAPANSSARMPVALPHGAEVVLLIEDEPQVQAVTARILRAFGYSVLTAHNERSAMAHAEQHGDAIGLVISDLVLPGVSGTDLVRRLQTPCEHARVLYMSGYSPDHIGALAEGVRFLRKPFTAEELVTTVRELLALRAAVH